LSRIEENPPEWVVVVQALGDDSWIGTDLGGVDIIHLGISTGNRSNHFMTASRDETRALLSSSSARFVTTTELRALRI
jgi:hypothetical protein